VLVFSGTPRDGHGQHQSSAILGKEAFLAAGDKARFREQLRWVEPWQPKRLMWNVFYWMSDQEKAARESKGSVEIEIGEYDPILGYSYAEIAAMSRSMHRSQGFGTAERRGAMRHYLVTVAGDPPERDVFDGIDTTWNRAGLPEAGGILVEAARTYEPAKPEKTIRLLLGARPAIAASKDPWARRKLTELDETLARLAGLWLDASADRHAATSGSSLKVDIDVVNRSRCPVMLTAVRLEGMADAPSLDRVVDLPYNQPFKHTFTVAVPADQPLSQPFWLEKEKKGALYSIDRQELIGVAEPAPPLRARFRLRFEQQEIELVRPVARRYVERAEGELVRPLVIVPPVAVRFAEPVVMFPQAAARKLDVVVKSNVAAAAGDLSLDLPRDWQADPKTQPFLLTAAGEEATLPFRIMPPSASARGDIRAFAVVGGQRISTGTEVIGYPHFPPQTVFPPARAELVRADIRTLARTVGYVMGAGDEVPQALRQLGCDVTLLFADDLARGDLSRFDAIVTGVRAFNTRPELKANHGRLMEYVESGGTLVVQYNVLSWNENPAALEHLGPFPLRVGRARVSVEEAPVAIPNPDHPLLQSPNRITTADFDGWVQERGLYFAESWDPRYQSLFESHDPGESPQPGGTLYARHGKGAYVFTAYSWFRQLPAGVPGAFRIFANLLSAGKSLP
jgi:hypothetical protein